jgi:succinate dehydrogenase / fumarate reductase membrane anchor subunit
VALTGAGYAEVRAWLASPVVATLMILLVISAFYHARLGLQVVTEDYVHHHGAKVVAVIALMLVIAALAAACIVSVLHISIGS